MSITGFDYGSQAVAGDHCRVGGPVGLKIWPPRSAKERTIEDITRALSHSAGLLQRTPRGQIPCTQNLPSFEMQYARTSGLSPRFDYSFRHVSS